MFAGPITWWDLWPLGFMLPGIVIWALALSLFLRGRMPMRGLVVASTCAALAVAALAVHWFTGNPLWPILIGATAGLAGWSYLLALLVRQRTLVFGRSAAAAPPKVRPHSHRAR